MSPGAMVTSTSCRVISIRLFASMCCFSTRDDFLGALIGDLEGDLEGDLDGDLGDLINN